ncbi:hypothetical protein F-liban_176 [Faustovirus]|nr:hypothetical protein F-liban_176 [Faustovirus]
MEGDARLSVEVSIAHRNKKTRGDRPKWSAKIEFLFFKIVIIQRQKIKDNMDKIDSDILFHVMGFINNSDYYDVSVLSFACVNKTLNDVYTQNQHFLLPGYLGNDPVEAAKVEADYIGWSQSYIMAFKKFHDLV